jgi:hypothetical protein
MITHICDRCGRPIEKGELRFVAKLQVFAAADTLEITPEDLAVDRRDEIANLLRQCGKLTEEELMRDVFVELRFDLCRRCQRAYLAAPLSGGSEGS